MDHAHSTHGGTSVVLHTGCFSIAHAPSFTRLRSASVYSSSVTAGSTAR